jgi:hypothetical protein
LQNSLDTPADNGLADFHVVYLLGSDWQQHKTQDAVNADLANIRNEVQALDGWFFSQSSMVPAFPRRLNVDSRQGQIEVTPWVSKYSSADLAMAPRPGVPDPYDTSVPPRQEMLNYDVMNGMLDQLVDDGLGSPFRRYLVYIDGNRLGIDGLCGFSPGQFTTLFMTNSCGSVNGSITADQVGNSKNTAEVALHEMLHGLGAVPALCRPDNVDDTTDPNYDPYSSRGHAKDPNDIMYWSLGDSTQPKHLDPTRQYYFGHAPDNCPDVSRSVFVRVASS